MLTYKQEYFFRGSKSAPTDNVEHFEQVDIQTGREPVDRVAQVEKKDEVTGAVSVVDVAIKAGTPIKELGWKRKSVAVSVDIETSATGDSIEGLALLDAVHSYIKLQFIDKFLAVPAQIDLKAFREWLVGDEREGGRSSSGIPREMVKAVLELLQAYIVETTGKEALANSTLYVVRQGFTSLALQSPNGFKCHPNKLDQLWLQISGMLDKFREAAGDDVAPLVEVWKKKLTAAQESYNTLADVDPFAV